MADLLWGKVYFQDRYAGTLREEPGRKCIFAYDPSYLAPESISLSVTLPKQKEPFINEDGLHPFFDNLVAEGWMESAQARALGKRRWKRFELLLAFGADCAGAVSVIDPDPERFKAQSTDTLAMDIAVMNSRASLSGVQPKLAMVKTGNGYRPAQRSETSTHIAKFESPQLPGIVDNEYLTTIATQALLPAEEVVTMKRLVLPPFREKALVITRFDRTPNHKLHFEEFAQAMNIHSEQKYGGAYEDLAHWMVSRHAAPTELFRLFRRIVVGLLLGNTDMHLKNFALWSEETGTGTHGPRLAPIYDQVSAALYHPKYQELALSIGRAKHLAIGQLKAKHLKALAKAFGLDDAQLRKTVLSLEQRIKPTYAAITSTPGIDSHLKKELISRIGKQWNGTFSLIGQH